jgi:hypothetical protein
LSELILSEKELLSREIKLKNGIFTKQGVSIDLNSWQLPHLRRAYIATEVMSTIVEVIRMLPVGSRLCIIDEFRVNRGGYVSPHFQAPRNLMAENRDCVDLTSGYKKLGEIDYYFPFYSFSFRKMLESLGLKIEIWDSEYHFAAVIGQTNEFPQQYVPENAFSQIILTSTISSKKLPQKILFPLDEKDLRSKKA